MPPRSRPVKSMVTVAAAAAVYAVMASLWAACAIVSPPCTVPEIPGGNPVIEEAVSGKMPSSPVTTDNPVLVMAEEAMMPKGAAEAKLT